MRLKIAVRFHSNVKKRVSVSIVALEIAVRIYSNVKDSCPFLPN